MRREAWGDFDAGNIHTTTADFHKRIYQASQDLFPCKIHKKRSTDEPWIDDDTRDMIDRRQRVFAKENVSAKWKDIRKKTNNMIRSHKKKFYAAEVSKLTTRGADKIHYKVLKNIADTERPKIWNPTELDPQQTDSDLAEGLADFFSSISQDKQRLINLEIPVLVRSLKSSNVELG